VPAAKPWQAHVAVLTMRMYSRSTQPAEHGPSSTAAKNRQHIIPRTISNQMYFVMEFGLANSIAVLATGTIEQIWHTLY
jgi:hypothetical protein